MIPPEYVVAAFLVAALICLIDVVKAAHWRNKVIRSCQAVILIIAAAYYGQAAIVNALPSSDVRVVWICLAIVTSAEVISRWQLGKKQ